MKSISYTYEQSLGVIQIDEKFRREPDARSICAGDVIPLNGEQWPVLAFGDEMMAVGEFLKLNVEAYSIAENWIYGTSVVTHT